MLIRNRSDAGNKQLILRRTEQAEVFAPEAKCNVATLVHMINQTGLLWRRHLFHRASLFDT